MGRKTQITQEMILEASYELLDEGGINNVEIKKIADRLGCSTRPVTWTFGSMAELKKALYFYAAGKAYGNLESKMKGKKPSRRSSSRVFTISRLPVSIPMCSGS